MSTGSLNRLYTDYFSHLPKSVKMNLPDNMGSGHITQVITRQGGAVLSEWQMKYAADTQACGRSSEEYVQFLFCVNEGVSWNIAGKNTDMDLRKGESCIYRGHGKSEYISYKNGKDYRFRSLRLPVVYLKEILRNYFGTAKSDIYESKLLTEVSKIQITPYMEHIFSELRGFGDYNDGVGQLFLDSKIQELLTAYLSEVLEIGLYRSGTPVFSGNEYEAIKNAKQIIDDQLVYAPTIEQLARKTGISSSKLSKGFASLYGMPVHAYIIDRRLEKAAALLMDGEYNITQIASMVGYAKPGNFAAAFKRKYGTVPKNYKEQHELKKLVLG